jgi:hypothetical protein
VAVEGINVERFDDDGGTEGGFAFGIHFAGVTAETNFSHAVAPAVDVLGKLGVIVQMQARLPTARKPIKKNQGR